MLDPKKKKLYLIIIAGAIVVAAGVIFYTRQSVPEVDLTAPVINPAAGRSAASTDKKNYPLPQVFPAETKFDTSIFDSSDFKILKPYTPTQITEGELGRENPFQAY